MTTKPKKTEYSGFMVLTFNLYNLPKVIDVAWYKVKVKMYFPNPMRCQKCQLLGHTKNKCNNPETCVFCNLPPHTPIDCSRLQCANCNEKHPASDRNCPRYLQQKEIIKIKTINKCSYGAAKRKYEVNITTIPQQKENQSYSEIIKNTAEISKKQPNKPIQKRPATSPDQNKDKKKPTRRDSSISSLSSEIETETPCCSSSLNTNIIENISSKNNIPYQQEFKQQNTFSNKYKQASPDHVLTLPLSETTNPKNTKQNKPKKSKENIEIYKNDLQKNSSLQNTSNSNSPLGLLTQELISKNEYYLSTSVMDTYSDS